MSCEPMFACWLDAGTFTTSVFFLAEQRRGWMSKKHRENQNAGCSAAGKESAMNRLLTGALGMALGLTQCGTATADSRHRQRCAYDRSAGDRHGECDPDGLPYCDPWRPHLDRHDWRDFDYWWFDPNPNDLRHFDYWRVNQYCLHQGQR
jgi:hypothetical protein